MIVQKGNKQLTVNEDMLKKYMSEGYDLLDDEGNVKEHATGGKTVSAAQHQKEVDALNKRIAELETTIEKLKKKKEAQQ